MKRFLLIHLFVIQYSYSSEFYLVKAPFNLVFWYGRSCAVDFILMLSTFSNFTLENNVGHPSKFHSDLEWQYL